MHDLKWVAAAIIIAAIFVMLGIVYANANSVKVLDGDTVIVDGTTVRLFGVDSPEKNQAGGLAAKEWLANRVAGVKLRVKPVKGRDGKTVDRYGRTIGVLYDGNHSINKELVLAGHAWSYTAYSSVYATYERIAREEKRGLWAYPCPQAPWQFREENRP